MTEAHYEGRCFCGAVRIEARGDPIVAGYCHCGDCRGWSGTPVTSFVFWPYDAVTISQGKEDVARFARIPATPRAWCARCGGHLGAFRDNADPPHVALSPSLFPALAFVPTMHVFCGEAVVVVTDGLPKYRDLPTSMPGTTIEGSGELMADTSSP